MIQQALQQLSRFFIENKMNKTLQSFKVQLAELIPQEPSQQLITAFNNQNENSYNLISRRKHHRKYFQESLEKKEEMMNNIVSRIAYSSNLLNDSKINKRVQTIMQSKMFKKLVENTEVLLENVSERPSESQKQKLSSVPIYTDQLDLAIAPSLNKQIKKQLRQESDLQYQYQNASIKNTQSHNSILIKNIPFEHSYRSNIVDEYESDLDLGYYKYVIKCNNKLKEKISQIIKKFNYPNCAIKKASSKNYVEKVVKSNKIKKLPAYVKLPEQHPQMYSVDTAKGIVYNAWNLKVIYNREKTGYQDAKDFPVIIDSIIAGRYKIIELVGEGVFAKVLKVEDIVQKKTTCLKLIMNIKQYFDQALDEIRILEYIKNNSDTDTHFLLTYEKCFYHRQHLFIQTELLQENLLSVYKNNKNFFNIPRIKVIAKQLLIALRQLHRLHIIHCDLKPQNILIKSYDPLVCKIVDLGNANFFHDHMGNYIQSRSYRAPQVILGLPATQKIDLWSLGCILAELWIENMLFSGLHIQGMLTRMQSILGPWPQWMIKEGNLAQNYFNKQNLIYLSERQPESIDIFIPKTTTLKYRLKTNDATFYEFIEILLEVDPNHRCSAEQALKHPFVAQNKL